MKNKLSYLAIVFLTLTALSCADELGKIAPKNVPTFDALSGEVGISALAKGGVYLNGFGGTYGSIDDGLGTGFQLLVYGMHEAMGDVIYVPWGNNDFKYLNNPTDIKFDDASISIMPIASVSPVGQPSEVRLRNSRSYGATNSILVEWTYMYIMNNAMNVILENVDKTAFSGDAATKKATMKAWAHFWKGYAYSRIGSMYISGLIIDKSYVTNGTYVTNTAIIAEAKNQFEQAKTLLGGITNTGDYNGLLSTIMPAYCLQNGIPTPAAFIRNCNTMEARNILVNKKIPGTIGPMAAMTATDWNDVKTLTAGGSGIGASDGVFVIKTTSNPSTSVIDPFFGAVGPYAATNDPTFFISEKLVQDIRQGDRRFDQNFALLSSPQVNRRGRGYNYGTRWYLVDDGTGAFPSTYTYSHTDVFGVDSHFMGASWEENQLMQAESLIQTGSIVAGTAIIDAVRTSQGANLGAIVAGTVALAMEELRSERRVALLFRSLAFYDARRRGIINDKAVGGGRGPGGALDVPGWDHEKNVATTGAVIMHPTIGTLTTGTGTTKININAFINYNFLNYWDIPKNELEYNAPTAGSSVIISPN